jgi:hypothetical protein
MFSIGLLVDGCKIGYNHNTDGEISTLWLLSEDSWASVIVSTSAVAQLGERRLWDEVEAAYGWWVGQQRPDFTRFGLSVEPSTQAVWLDGPDYVIKRLPPA